MLATSDYGQNIQENINAVVTDGKFNAAPVRHVLDEKNKGVFDSSAPLSVTFKDVKKNLMFKTQYNILVNKNLKFLFYDFNDYLKQIIEPMKPVHHTAVTDDESTLEILQRKNWQYFIEIILEICQSNNGAELTQLVSAKEIKITENSVENFTICKSLYTNFCNQIASNLSDALRNYRQMS